MKIENEINISKELRFDHKKLWSKVEQSYILRYRIKIKKYHIVKTFPKSNSKILERNKIDTPNTQIRVRDRSFSGVVTGTSIKSGGVFCVVFFWWGACCSSV